MTKSNIPIVPEPTRRGCTAKPFLALAVSGTAAATITAEKEERGGALTSVSQHCAQESFLSLGYDFRLFGVNYPTGIRN